MNAGEFVLIAELSCESCDFTAEDSGSAMVHALTIGHTVSGETPGGDTVTISITDD
jgi:hypothetical protein